EGGGEDGDAANPRRILPRSYAAALALIDGRRSVGAIKREMSRRCALPLDVLEGQVFRLLKDLAVLGAVAWIEAPEAASTAPDTLTPGDSWEDFRLGEAALRRGDPSTAEAALNRAIAAGAPGAWAYALRGEALRHLGRTDDAARDLDEALRLCAISGVRSEGSRLDALRDEFESGVERAMIEDRVRLLRAKLRLVSGNARGAREDADAALKFNPRQSEALVVRAKAAQVLGDLEAAKADLQDALAIESAGRRGEG
ncbi:MAG: hypothetical protein COV48_03865, partial [Elusimicrobia bacterium CG11_big_fil_rev_8_21_14_0_20_64_6]